MYTGSKRRWRHDSPIVAPTTGAQIRSSRGLDEGFAGDDQLQSNAAQMNRMR